jgi:lactate dehydrogenase-like 2-hydroxyacid dehydrogenase
MTQDVLSFIELTPERLSLAHAAGFNVLMGATAESRERHFKEKGHALRAVLTNGSVGISATEISALPKLEIICAQGAGYENIDLAATRARGIVVTYGPGTNSECVADHAIALLGALVRNIPQLDAASRAGRWAESRDSRPSLTGKKLGLLGYGQIGQKIAARGAGGFNMQLGYHARQPKPNCAERYFSTPVALAGWADFLIIAIPGGDLTKHIAGASVLDALGPGGFLVNIARGSVVDNKALTEALINRRIAGAALDVVDGEPHVPSGWASLDNLIMTPHVAGRSPEALLATMQLVVDNLAAHFAGRPALTPIPG